MRHFRAQVIHAALTVVAASFLLVSPQLGQAGPILLSEIEATVVRVVDGDTIVVTLVGSCSLLGEEIGVRLAGIDTPELRSSNMVLRGMAKEAKAVVEGLLPVSRHVVLRNVRRGKFFRLVADVHADGVNVSSQLLEKGLALPYDGKRKPDWEQQLH